MDIEGDFWYRTRRGRCSISRANETRFQRVRGFCNDNGDDKEL